MKLLREILYKVEINSVVGNTSLSINKIEFDSRLISDGDLYIAITGVNVDGHSFISQAIKNGMTPLRDAGIDKIKSGESTVEEILRATVEDV